MLSCSKRTGPTFIIESIHIIHSVLRVIFRYSMASKTYGRIFLLATIRCSRSNIPSYYRHCICESFFQARPVRSFIAVFGSAGKIFVAVVTLLKPVAVVVVVVQTPSSRHVLVIAVIAASSEVVMVMPISAWYQRREFARIARCHPAFVAGCCRLPLLCLYREILNREIQYHRPPCIVPLSSRRCLLANAVEIPSF